MYAGTIIVGVFSSSLLLANIDPINDVGNEEVLPGFFVQLYTAKRIQELNIIEEVFQLYRTFKHTEEKGESIGMVKNSCFALYIRTKDSLAVSLDQFMTLDKKCLKKIDSKSVPQ